MATPARDRQHDFFVYVDTVVLTVSREKSLEPKERLQVLVMHRPEAAKDKWALPGGLVADNEDLPDTALRIVKRETGLTVPKADLIQVGTYGKPNRDSRWRAISVAYVVLVPEPETPAPESNSDDARFMPYRTLRDDGILEFDHRTIIRDARRTARQQLEDTPIALKFCKHEFTLTDLRWVYEAFVLDKVDPANFRRKVEQANDFVRASDSLITFGSEPGRPARLYTAGKTKYLNPPIRFRRKLRPR
jgi:8-oxo-dGTP diphosphatase